MDRQHSQRDRKPDLSPSTPERVASSNSGATRVPAWAKTLGPQSPTEEPAREELHVQAKAEDGQTADVPEPTTPATSGALLVEYDVG